MISGGMPWVSDVNHWNFTAATKATQTIWNKTPDFTREGGSIPITLTFAKALGVNGMFDLFLVHMFYSTSC